MKISKRLTKLYIELEELCLKNKENYTELDMCILQLFRSNNKKGSRYRWKVSELLSHMRSLVCSGEKYKNNHCLYSLLIGDFNDLNIIKAIVIDGDQFEFGIKYYMFLLNLLCDNKLYNSLEFLIKNYGISINLIHDIYERCYTLKKRENNL